MVQLQYELYHFCTKKLRTQKKHANIERIMTKKERCERRKMQKNGEAVSRHLLYKTP